MTFIDIGPSSIIENSRKEPKKMLGLEKIGSKYWVTINNSSLSIMQACMRKAGYALAQNLVSVTESPALIAGTAVHAWLEEFYSAPRSARSIPYEMHKNLQLMAYGNEVPGQQDNLIFRATEKLIQAASSLSHLDPMDKRSIPNLCWIMGEYAESFIDDPYEVYRDADGNPMVEKYLEFEIYDSSELNIKIHGQIDLILKNTANGQILVGDHKTSSQVGQDFYNRLKPNHQYTGYLLLAQECLGIDTDQFLVNCIQIKPKPKTSRGMAPHFPRQVTTRTKEDMEEYKKSVIYYVTSYLQCLEAGFFPIGSVDSCAMWGGCQYLKICSSPNMIKENIISAEYRGNE